MAMGNATGSAQIAGTPSCAPYKPTATIGCLGDSLGFSINPKMQQKSSCRRPLVSSEQLVVKPVTTRIDALNGWCLWCSPNKLFDD